MTFPQILAFLTDTHTVTPWALLTAAVFLSVYATRKLLPALWVAFDKITPDGALGHMLQGLPSVLLGALVGAIAAGKDPGSAWKGALAGAAAPVLHLVLKALPVPYQGAVAAVIARTGLNIMLVLGAIGLAGCASIGVWSHAAAPDVAALCAFSGDVEPQLEALAAQSGVPLWVVQDAFKAACSETAKSSPDNARVSGLLAARASAHAIRAMRAGDGNDAGAP